MPSDSKNSESPTIERVFGLLDRWRHLPNYQLERRADVFFALFLPEVLTKHLSEVNCPAKIEPVLIPEFPIREEETTKKGSNNRSKKADYLAISEDGGRAFLIELKTDVASIDRDQIYFLKCASRRGMAKIICGLKSIAKSDSVRKNSAIRGKYFHLFNILKKLDLIRIPDIDCLKNLIPRGAMNKKEYECHIGNIEIRKCPKLEVVYILPEKPQNENINDLMRDVHQIPFEEFAECAKNRGAIGSQFAKSLKSWKRQAGLCPPQ